MFCIYVRIICSLNFINNIFIYFSLKILYVNYLRIKVFTVDKLHSDQKVSDTNAISRLDSRSSDLLLA